MENKLIARAPGDRADFGLMFLTPKSSASTKKL
jgi:hypothetical protein